MTLGGFARRGYGRPGPAGGPTRRQWWHALGVRAAWDRPANRAGPDSQEGLMATAAQAQQISMQLDRIHVPGNVRSL